MASGSRSRVSRFGAAFSLLSLGVAGCVCTPETPPRAGDSIIIAGRRVEAGTRVITWNEAGGLDAYRAARLDSSGAPESYGTRRSAEEKAIAAGDFDAVARVVDQIVLHYDGIGSSRGCFEMLRERRLSAHFLIDVDGAIYQTLDVQERAYHATIANNRSIGIEIAGVGAYPANAPAAAELRDALRGSIHGIELVQEDFTPAQYGALARLIDALCRTLPLIEHRLPRDEDGRVAMTRLSDDELADFSGILGHFHIQENKVDPGPAFQWERILSP